MKIHQILLFVAAIVVAIFTSSCATNTCYPSGGGGYSSKGCRVPGGPHVAQASNVNFKMFNLELRPGVSGYIGGGGYYNAGYRSSCPPPRYSSPYGQPRPQCPPPGYGSRPPGYGGPPPGYRPPPRPYYGSSGNPIVVGGFGFSDQYPAGRPMPPPPRY